MNALIINCSPVRDGATFTAGNFLSSMLPETRKVYFVRLWDVKDSMEILLEQLTHDNYMDALSINRDDIPEEWVDNASYLMGVTDYGAEHHLMGHTFLCRVNEKPVGLIMIGEALAWDTDPVEMRGKTFLQGNGISNR